MPRFLLFAIVFIEGFCSLGAEVIALRQIVPHMGSSIVVTAPTIGFFLLALALGYHAGAKVDSDYLAVVARNFLIAAALTYWVVNVRRRWYAADLLAIEKEAQ